MSEIYQTTADGKMRVLRPGDPGYVEARSELPAPACSATFRCLHCYDFGVVRSGGQQEDMVPCPQCVPPSPNNDSATPVADPK